MSLTMLRASSGVIIGSLLSFFLMRGKSIAEIRKITAEAKKSEIDGIQSIVNLWKDANAELKSQLATVLLREGVLLKERDELLKENKELKDQIRNLKPVEGCS